MGRMGLTKQCRSKYNFSNYNDYFVIRSKQLEGLENYDIVIADATHINQASRTKTLRALGNMVYPMSGNTKGKATYVPPSAGTTNFSPNMNDTLDKMKNNL